MIICLIGQVSLVMVLVCVLVYAEQMSSHTFLSQVATHDQPRVSCQLMVILLSPRSLID